MRVFFAILLALAAVPASAETFRFRRTVTPPPLSEPAVVGIQLTPTMRSEGAYRIVTSTGFAVPFRSDGIARDLLPKASIVGAPPGADTLPRTTPEMIRGDGVFQPVAAPVYSFRFSFPEPVTPVELDVELASGAIESIEVLGGLSSDGLTRMFAGPSYGVTRVQLSGERVRFVDVRIAASGVLRIDTIRLLDRPNFLFFRAVPGKTYALLSGGTDEGTVQLFPGYDALRGGPYDPNLLVALGESGPVTAQDDHDAVPASTDNCPDRWNWRQDDVDGDGVGDACDPCPTVADGEDADGNGRCDALEDPDLDGIATQHDNCPTVLNRLQEDQDADGVGDACDDRFDVLSANRLWLTALGIAALVLALAWGTYESLKIRKDTI